jgi:hypothetical protein
MTDYMNHFDGIILEPKHFDECPWRGVLSKLSQKNYINIWNAFFKAANECVEKEDFINGKVFWLLANICTMEIDNSSINNPFKPGMVMLDKRTLSLDDITQDEEELFSKIVDNIDEPLLRARIADILWTKNRKRGFKFALMAIDAYCQIKIKLESYYEEIKYWKRALELALRLKEGAADKVKNIEDSLINKLKESSTENGYLSLFLADVLEKSNIASVDCSDIAKNLEEHAYIFEDQGCFNQARDYYDASSRWFKRSADEEKAVENIKNIAECFCAEADLRKEAEQSSNVAAAYLYSKAIQKYREIPKSYRDKFNVDERVKELHTLLKEAGIRSLEEMSRYGIENINISPLVELSLKAVSNKAPKEALDNFVRLFRFPGVKHIKEEVERQLQRFPLLSLLSFSVLSRDGRFIAKHPGMTLNGDTIENQTSVFPEMIRYYATWINIKVHGSILPALDILRLEHRLTERDFISIAIRSPIVPPERARLFGKAFFAGYDGDFVTAIHILIPQIENFVRFHLKHRDIKTTTLDRNGIETENGLSTLMQIEDVNKILGEDLSFEFTALLCSAFGPNIRNELAHGLFTEEDCNSVYSIYVWYLILKIVFDSVILYEAQYE